MTKFILIGGRIYTAPDGGKSFCEEMVKGVDSNNPKILDCMFGRPEEEWEKRFDDDESFFDKNLGGYQLILARPEQFVEQVKIADILFFQGARPEDMMKVLKETGPWEKELEGKVVVGTSGGASLLAKYFGTGKSTSGAPRLGEGLGLLPIKFIPHFKTKYEGLDIDWEGLREKLKSHGEDLEVITLAEGEFKVIQWKCGSSF